ncbi:MAG: histidine kinase, partial [Desulfosporosinus sp.]|nr:histidine kinase [Desulfosporosinus sp.]
LGYINAILDGIVKDPEQLERYLHRIRERITGLNNLTQELFDLIQLESSKVKLEVHVISVEKLIQKIYDKYLLDVQRAGINFILLPANKSAYSSDSSTVEVDIDRIDRAIANIIYNAIKHTPNEGTITLDYFLSNMEIVITITDNGSGIATADLPHVFNRFFTGSKSRTSGSGSGLGLSIAKEIVEYHNGRVWVTSKPEEGTRFYLSLPLSNL